MPFRGWPVLALALGLVACSGDPDLPRSYRQPGMFARDHAPPRDEVVAVSPPYAPTPYSPPQRAPDGYAPPAYRPELIPASAPPPPAATRFADWTADDYHYRIGPGDELALRFLLNPDLNGPVIVGPDGRGVVPLAGAIKVADLTTDQANAALTGAYGRILRKPQVEVLITAYGSSQIFVGGEVRNPGAVPIKGQLTPAQAVMAAGGLLPTARTGRIAVIRQRPNGELLMKEVDLKAYLTKGQGEAGFAVLPGDLIFAPRSKIAEVDLFVQQYIEGVLPFSRGVSYNLNDRKPY
jgi:protein involved in polysaccharide export with SLBB domain